MNCESGPAEGGTIRRWLWPTGRRLILTFGGIGLLASVAAAAPRTDAVILNPARYEILAGRYSPFAAFQTNLQRLLDQCGKGTPSVLPTGEDAAGRLGAATRYGIQRALDCPPLRDVPADSPARSGIITDGVWHAIMGEGRAPTAEDRAHAMVLSFEATDFGDAPEWNLCQDGERRRQGTAKAAGNDLVCYNESDPCSFMTWGPRGATAGAGREIQLVLWMVSKQDPALLQKAFGAEYPNLRRFFQLKGGGKSKCDGDIPLKRFVCAVWMDKTRRTIWEQALTALGHSALVRKAYTELYALSDFDGTKLQDYYAIWRELGLRPSEIDYAFFLDRTTHLGGPPEEDSAVARLGKCLHEERTKALTPNAAARRCLAQQQPHETQPEYRLARDVAYYLDSYPEGSLSEREISTWAGYVPLSATYNFGLSDTETVAITEAPSLASLNPDLPRAQSSELTSAELKACPVSVLSPIRRKPPR
ncbi:MAG: hypothetical protein ACKVP3_05485 [Hyphomicrobiaceae bacterium]